MNPSTDYIVPSLTSCAQRMFTYYEFYLENKISKETFISALQNETRRYLIYSTEILNSRLV